MTVTDAAGCTATAFLHVKAYTFAVFIIDFNVSCAGAELILAYPDFPAGTGFLWSTGETTNTILAPNSGTYSITVTDPTGSCTASNSLTVTVPDGGTPPSLSCQLFIALEVTTS